MLYLFSACWATTSLAGEPGRVTNLMTKALVGFPGKEVTMITVDYPPGAMDTFYEDPSGIHLVGRNASDTKPAKFLVFLVKDKGAPILVPVTK